VPKFLFFNSRKSTKL